MTLRQLLNPKTEREVYGLVLAALNDLNFPITDFISGGVSEQLTRTDAYMLYDLYQYVPKIASAGYLELAEGDWLELYAKDAYQEVRKGSSFARHRLTFTAATGATYAIQKGATWAQDSAGNLFVATGDANVTDVNPVDVIFQAESPGSKYNVSPTTITSLLTPATGISVTNKVGSLVAAGAEKETDERLRQRCRYKWGALNPGDPPWTAYAYWALTAAAGITKVHVQHDHPRGRGTVDVYVYGDGGIGDEDYQAASDTIAIRRGIVTDAQTHKAQGYNLQLLANIYITSGSRSFVEPAILEALGKVEASVPIGGVLYHSDVIEALAGPTAVRNVSLNSLQADFYLQPLQAVNLTLLASYIEV